MRGKTWRHGLFDHRDGPLDGGTASSAGPPPAPASEHAGGQRVWAFLCPNPLCDTELVIFPEYAGGLVECPTCGFTFVAPRAVPMQVIPESEPGSATTRRPFAPGAVMVRPGGAGGRGRGAGVQAPLPPLRDAPPGAEAHPSRELHPSRDRKGAGAARSPLASAPASPKAAGAADVLDAFAHGAPLPAGARGPGHGAPPAGPPSGAPPLGALPSGAPPLGALPSGAPPLGALSSGAPPSVAPPGADGPARPKAADTEALRALARAAADEAAHPAPKKSGAAKPKGVGATLASATLEGERRRAARIHTAAEASAARMHAVAETSAARTRTPAETSPARAADPAAPWQSAVPDGPLSEGERAAARQRRTDLVVTWAVAAVVSAALALAAYLTGVPDIGLGALLFVGLAGLRTYWIGRAGRTNGPPPRP